MSLVDTGRERFPGTGPAGREAPGTEPSETLRAEI